MPRIRAADVALDVHPNFDIEDAFFGRVDVTREYLVEAFAGISNPTNPFNLTVATGGINQAWEGTVVGPGGGIFGPVNSLTTGASATGRAYWGFGSGSVLFTFDGWETLLQRNIFFLPQLSDAVEEWDFGLGFSDVVTSVTQTDGAFMFYDRNTSLNWQIQNRAGGAGAAVDTGVVVEANVGYESIVAFRSNPTPRVEYWLATITTPYRMIGAIATNIPTGAQQFGAGSSIIKSLGAGARTAQFAYQGVYGRRSTPVGVETPKSLGF